MLDAVVPAVPMDVLAAMSSALPILAIASMVALAVAAIGFLVVAIRDEKRRRHAVEVLATSSLGAAAVAAATLHDDAVYRLRFRLDADAWAPRFEWLAVASCGVVGLLAAVMIIRADSSGRSRAWSVVRDLSWASVSAVVIVGSAPGARAGNLRSFAVAALVPILAVLVWRAINAGHSRMEPTAAQIWGNRMMTAMIGLVLLTAVFAIPKRGIAPGAVTLATAVQAESYAVYVEITYAGCSGGTQVGWDDIRSVTVEEAPDAVLIQAMVRYPPSVGGAFTCPGIPSEVKRIACTVLLASPIESRDVLVRRGDEIQPIDEGRALDGSIYTDTCPAG